MSAVSRAATSSGRAPAAGVRNTGAVTEPHAHETLPVRSADGATTVAESYGDNGPHVLFLPALGVPLHYYRPFLGRWAARGFRIVALELRGMPQSSTTDVRRTDFGYRHSLALDIPAVLEQSPLRGADLVVAGHSLGGQLALLHAAADPHRVRAVVTIASGSSHHGALSGVAERLKRRAQVGTILGITRALGWFPGHRLGFGGRQPRTMMSDWGHEGRHGRFALAGSTVDHEAQLAALARPVLMLTLDGDPILPRSSSDALGVRLVAADRTAVHIDRRENGGESFDHFRWARRTPDVVLDPVTGWLGDTLR
jgi:predicted alpha/beta hydrolase